MKKFFLRIGLGIIFAATFVISIHLSLADTTTPNLSLVKPSIGSAGWGTTINNNYDTIDAQFGSTTGHDHTGVAGEGPKIPIAGGGTNATTAATARTNLGAAASGANTDITSLKALTGAAIGIGLSSPIYPVEIEGTSLATTTINTRTYSDTENMQFITERARGSLATPFAVQSGDNLGAWSFRGHTGSAFTGSKALIAGRATETWTASANGTLILFQTTANGSTTLTSRMVIENDGNVGIGDLSPIAALTVGSGDDFQVSSTGEVTTNETIKSTRSTDLGWTVQNAANQACNTTCTTGACVVGINTAAVGNFLSCSDSTADSCLCAA